VSTQRTPADRLETDAPELGGEALSLAWEEPAFGAEDVGAFRALQGVGGGIITAAVFAAVPSLFSRAACARIVGLFTGTYGLASILGPLLASLWVHVPFRAR
jgi:MFS family permease